MRDDRSRIELDVEVGRERPAVRPDDDTPFRIAIIGDLSGRGSRSDNAPPGRGSWRIDRDEFDDVLRRVSPRVRLGRGGSALEVSVSDIDEFHPDSLFDRLEVFSSLRALRKRLASPATAADAVAEIVGGRSDTPSGARPESRATPSGSGVESSAGLLDQIVGEA